MRTLVTLTDPLYPSGEYFLRRLSSCTGGQWSRRSRNGQSIQLLTSRKSYTKYKRGVPDLSYVRQVPRSKPQLVSVTFRRLSTSSPRVLSSWNKVPHYSTVPTFTVVSGTLSPSPLSNVEVTVGTAKDSRTTTFTRTRMTLYPDTT